MKRTITEIRITEEETGENHTSTGSDSTPGDGMLTLLLVLAIVIGLHSFMGRRNQPPIIDQRGNSGVIVNEWEGSYEQR